MLGYILVKDEMLLPDRNFLRRILVKTFEEDLIQSGSRNFIHHLRYLQRNIDYWNYLKIR